MKSTSLPNLTDQFCFGISDFNQTAQREDEYIGFFVMLVEMRTKECVPTKEERVLSWLPDQQTGEIGHSSVTHTRHEDSTRRLDQVTDHPFLLYHNRCCLLQPVWDPDAQPWWGGGRCCIYVGGCCIQNTSHALLVGLVWLIPCPLWVCSDHRAAAETRWQGSTGRIWLMVRSCLTVSSCRARLCKSSPKSS